MYFWRRKPWREQAVCYERAGMKPGKILEKAVERGKTRELNTPMPRIGIDEKAFRKGHSYITLIYALDRSTVEAISDGKDIQAGSTAFSQLS
jgi:transposase